MCEIVDVTEETVEKLREERRIREKRRHERQLEVDTMAGIMRELLELTDVGRKV